MPSDRELEFYGKTAKPKRCQTCNGTGRFRMWSSTMGGSEIVEYECNCDDQLILDRWFAVRGIHPPHSRLRWFDLIGLDDAFKPEVREAAGRLERDLERGLGLVLGGPTHTGKSLIASLMARYVLKDGHHDVRIVTAADVSTLNYKDEERMEWWERKVKPVRLLVFDGLGREGDTSWVKGKVEDLFAYRADHQLAMVVVTRLTIEKVRERYGVDDGSGVVTDQIAPGKVAVRYASRVADLMQHQCRTLLFKNDSFQPTQLAMKARESDADIMRPVTFI